MRHSRRILATAAAAGIAVLGLAVGPVTHAGASASVCEDSPTPVNGGDDIPILGGTFGLPAPLTLGVEVSGGTAENTPLPAGALHLALCVATDNAAAPVGSTPISTLIAVDVLDGMAYSNPSDNTVNLNCLNDTNAQVTPVCATGVRPTAVVTPCAGFTCGATVALSIPFSTCVGSNVTGQAVCSGGAPTVKSTGLLLAGLAVTPPPPGTTTGATATLTSVAVYVDGVTVFSSAGSAVGAGANPSAVGAGAGSGGGLFVSTTGTAPVAAIEIGGAVFPVTVPSNCFGILQPKCP